MNAPDLQPFPPKKGPTIGEMIRRCLLTGPRDVDTIRRVKIISHAMRFEQGFSYEKSMEVVELANRGAVKDPREVWEELLQVADKWESLT